MGKVTIVGEKALMRKLKRMPELLDPALRRAVKDETAESVQDLRRDAPVDTGELQDSIQAESEDAGMVGKAVITAKHATYVIHGTSDTPADDFVTPVEQEVRKRFPKRVITEVNQEIRRL